MKHRKGFFGRATKANDAILIEWITEIINHEDYEPDHMTDAICDYIHRYNKIKSLTDKMRYHIKTHIELHRKDV